MHTDTLDELRRELEADRPRHARALMSPAARARPSSAAFWACIAGTQSTRSAAGTGIRTPASIGARSGAITATRSRRSSRDFSPSNSPRRTTSRPLLHLIRESYGRSQWHVSWGAEEVRHADLWRNAVVALGRRDQPWIEEYTSELRGTNGPCPGNRRGTCVFYQVIQERATQVSYLNLGLALTGKVPRLQTPSDDALATACRLISVDEAAHYAFFVEVARLLLDYEPEASLEALVDVLRHFTMPARDIIPDYDTFGRVLHDSGVFGRTIHYRDVVRVVLDTLSAPALQGAGGRRPRAPARFHAATGSPDGGVPRHAESAGDRTQGLRNCFDETNLISCGAVSIGCSPLLGARLDI